MDRHNFKGAANRVLRILQRMSRDIRCNIYIAPEISRDIQCNIYISPDVHVAVNTVAMNARRASSDRNVANLAFDLN